MDDIDEGTAPMSPCISICVLDEADTCTGCFRTLDEIVDWPSMSPAQKRDVVARLGDRQPSNGTDG
jgi:predicted Fe-S protein YdhL (DUF1289 family)